MAKLQERGGQVNVRIGGNTQENATFVDSIPGGLSITKTQGAWVTSVCLTCSLSSFQCADDFAIDQSESPDLTLSSEFLYMLANVSSLVNTKWYLGGLFDVQT